MVVRYLRPWLLHAIDGNTHYVACSWCGLLFSNADAMQNHNGEFTPTWLHTPHSRATALHAILEHKRCAPIAA